MQELSPSFLALPGFFFGLPLGSSPLCFHFDEFLPVLLIYQALLLVFGRDVFVRRQGSAARGLDQDNEEVCSTTEKRPESEKAESVKDEFAEGEEWYVADCEDSQHCCEGVQQHGGGGGAGGRYAAAYLGVSVVEGSDVSSLPGIADMASSMLAARVAAQSETQ